MSEVLIRQAADLITKDLGAAAEPFHHIAAASFVEHRSLIGRIVHGSFSDVGHALLVRHRVNLVAMNEALVLAMLADLQVAMGIGMPAGYSPAGGA